MLPFLPSFFCPVGHSNQENLCGRPVGEHDYRGRQAVLRPVWEGELWVHAVRTQTSQSLHKFAGAETNQQLRKPVVPHPTSSAGSDSQQILREKLHFESSDLTGSEGVTARRGSGGARKKDSTRTEKNNEARRVWEQQAKFGGLEDGARGGGGSGGGGCVRKGEKSFVVSVW